MLSIAHLVLASVLAGPQAVFPGELNVRDFGAKGDGVADDTAAIETALAASLKHDNALRDCWNFGENDGPHQSIVFPAGTYRITRTLFATRDVNLRGLPGAEIVLGRSDADILYVFKAARVHIEGLGFRGGRHQVNVATLNHENANVIVRNCVFANAVSNGFHSVSRITREVPEDAHFDGTGRKGIQPINEFMPDSNGVFRVDERFGRAEGFNNSTFFMIEDSLFDRCAHAMEMHSDGGVIRRCRVIHPASSAGAPFILPMLTCSASAEFHYYDLDVLVERNPKLDQSFFDLEFGTHVIAIDDSRFRTSDGSGIALFDSRSASPYFFSSLIVRNVSVACGGGAKNSVLYLRNNSAAQILDFENVTDTTGQPVRLVGTEGEVDDPWLHKALDRFDDNRVPLEKRYTFTFTGLSTNISTDLGKVLNRFVKPFPKDLAKCEVPRRPIETYAGWMLKAADFGVVADGKTDDTAAMQRLADALAADPGSVGVLPNEWVLLSSPVKLSGRCALMAPGTAAFKHATDKTAFFEIANGAQVKFRNLVFKDGKHVVRFEADRAEPTSIVLDNCFAYHTERWDKFDGAKFDIRARENAEAVSLTITGGSYYAPVMYRGNVTSLFDGFWFRSYPKEDRKDFPSAVAFVNERGGRMRAADILGVPIVLSKRGRMSYNRDQYQGEYRWFDNFDGDLLCENVRFGGEYGGIVPVFAYGKARTLVMGQFSEYKTYGNRVQSPIVSDSPEAESVMFSTLHLSRLLDPVQVPRIRFENSLWLGQ